MSMTTATRSGTKEDGGEVIRQMQLSALSVNRWGHAINPPIADVDYAAINHTAQPPEPCLYLVYGEK